MRIKHSVRWAALVVALSSVVVAFTSVDSFRQLANEIWEHYSTDLSGSTERILPLVDYRAGDLGSVEFLYTTNEGPTGLWDPCKEVRLSINPKYEPTGFREIFEDQVGWASSRSGIAMKIVGETLEPPSANRLPSENRNWKDVLVAFLPEKEFLTLANEIGYLDRTIGLGGPDVASATSNEDHLVAVSGILYFNSTWIEDDLRTGNLNEGFGVNVGPLIQHEVGHLLGLDHFGDGLMSADGTSNYVDPTVLRAFASTGQARCLESSEYPSPGAIATEEKTSDNAHQSLQSIQSLTEAVSKSYELLESDVVVEYSGDWITIFAPGYTEHYSSAEFYGPDDEGSLALHAASNIYWLWAMLQESNVRIQPSAEGFIVSHPNYVEIFVVLDDGLVSLTSRSDRNYDTTHFYEVVEPYLSRLLELEKEVVSSW